MSDITNEETVAEFKEIEVIYGILIELASTTWDDEAETKVLITRS
ncbi:hypothetical protein J11TS1_23760 [Oceanobacillus sp. J11TS1]|nr:hypothetical protein J11TS1_23760 [Oceanobacillus sp. J11TS1]